MGRLTYCLMCLGTEYNLSIKHMHACYECSYLLHKYAKFRIKCCKAYNIVWNLSPGSLEVTQEDLKHIDRKQNKLESLLTVCTSTAYYEPQKQNYESNMQINIQTVKREREESINTRDRCNETILQLQENSVQAINTTYRNNVESEIYTELESVTNTSECDNEEEYKSSLGVKISNYDANNESAIGLNVHNQTLQDSDLDSIEIDHNKVSKSRSPNNLHVECFENNRDPIISDKYPAKVNNNHMNKVILNQNLTKMTKRKYVTQNENTQSNVIMNKNNEDYDLFDSTELVSDGEDKPIKKKKPETNKNRRSKVPVKTEEDRRLTIDSNFFRDHMTVIKLAPEDARSELLLRKESRNYKMNSHKCELCYRGFISEATYEAHMKKHSSVYGPIKCDICQLSFSDNRSLSRHWSMCHTWKLLCKTCTYMCFNINQAKSHIQSHKGKEYTCKDCAESFRYPNSLSTHMRLKHSIELVCEFCGSTFASPQGMDCHKRLRHRKEKNEHRGPQCDECDVHFASELAWKRHRVLCSRHAVQNGCAICGETFPSRVELRGHSREHGEPTTTAHSRSRKMMEYKPLPCELCKKELHSRKAYVKHMDTEHPQDTNKRLTSNCVCEVCGRTFRHRSFLIAHQRKHTDEKPFSCPHCGKRFKNAYAVKMHLPLHTNEYTFKCHLCEKAFGDRGKLNRHLKGHLGIRPYKCSYCEKTFMFQCEERLHTKYVHCKEPYPKRDRRKRNAVKEENIK